MIEFISIQMKKPCAEIWQRKAPSVYNMIKLAGAIQCSPCPSILDYFLSLCGCEREKGILKYKPVYHHPREPDRSPKPFLLINY
jgi:hypothetical protein